MKALFRFLLFCFICTYCLCGFSSADPAAENLAEEKAEAASTADVAVEGGAVCVINVDGMVERGLLYVMRRAVREAKRKDASLIILDMDTPGGRLDASEEIIRLLLDIPDSIKTCTYVNPDALSAGSFIALATDEIYMAPHSRIGASAIISSSGDIPDGETKAKVYSASEALITSAAESKGHDPNLVRAMMEVDYEYKIGNEVIVEKGKLLTLTAHTATKVYTNDTPLLAAGVVDSLEELIDRIGADKERVFTVEQTSMESVARWIETFSMIFLIGGVLGIYIEIKTPGFGFPGITGILLLSIFFWGHNIAGLSGSLEVVVFLLGLILVALEIFVIPGFGVAGISGIICIILSLFLAMVEHSPWDGVFEIPAVDVTAAMDKLLLSFFIIIIAAILLAKYLPKTRFFGKVALVSGLPKGDSESIKTSSGLKSDELVVGQKGYAFSSLRPSGTGEFDGNKYSVISNGDFIDKGSRITIVEVKDNNHIYVERSDA